MSTSRQTMLTAVALLALVAPMKAIAAENSSSWQLAQASPPAAQKNALGTATQVTGKIKAIDTTARTLTMENNQILTVPRAVEFGPWKPGDTVLVTFEPDTTTAISIETGANIR